jgi:hypothetical protein
MKKEIISFVVFVLFVFLVGIGFGIQLIKAEPLDTGNPFDFIPNTCLCSDMKKLNGDLVGKACMCESTADWPGKVLVFFLLPEGLDVMRYHLNDLAEPMNRERLFRRWGIKIE